MLTDNETRPEREKKLETYLSGLVEDMDISPETRGLAWETWKTLCDIEPSVPVPDCAAGPEGEVSLVWDKGEHHLSAEIFKEGGRDFFYRNRETRQCWCDDYESGQELHYGRLGDYLPLFVEEQSTTPPTRGGACP